MLARAIATARQAAGLSHEQFAALLELNPATIRAWESGARPIEPVQLDVIAGLFGLEVPQLLGADLRTSPSTLLYRSMAESPALERFAGDRLPHQLGEFMRCARIVAECEQLSGAPAASLAWLDELGPEPLPVGSRAPHGAEELATRVRARLGLGDRPIPSMRALLRELGVALFFADPDTLHPAVDAACMLHPRPAILVNVTAGGDRWWRTRMSLAHELAHLCFDRDVLGAPRRFFLFSPAERAARSWHLFDRFEAIEQRANAFAAYFLAPPVAVRALVSRASAATPAALRTVARHFGVGHETAANILTNVFELSDVQRGALITGRPVELPSTHPDRVVRPRLRDDDFVARVLKLHREQVIDGVRARRWLRVPAHEPLPDGFGLADAQRAPLVSQGDRVRQRIEYLIHQTLGDRALRVGRVETLDAAKLRALVVRRGNEDVEAIVGHVDVGAEDLRILGTAGPDLAALAAP